MLGHLWEVISLTSDVESNYTLFYKLSYGEYKAYGSEQRSTVSRSAATIRLHLPTHEQPCTPLITLYHDTPYLI